jgi:ribosomal-protein-alanine N-acetyltransferase
MLDQIILRKPVLTDITEITEISIECFGKEGTFSRESTAKYILNRLGYVLTDGHKVVGFILCSYKTKIKAINFDCIAITNAYRGKGFGRKMINKCFEDSVLYDVYCFTLHVDIKNEIAFNLYKSMGFEVFEYIKEYYEDDSDAYFMILNTDDE